MVFPALVGATVSGISVDLLDLPLECIVGGSPGELRAGGPVRLLIHWLPGPGREDSLT